MRVEEWWTGRVWKEFAYAANQTAPNYRLGKLLTATRHNYVLVPGSGDLSVTETYTYKGRGGRVSNKSTSLSSGDSYAQSFVWNELGDLQSQTYPQCQHAACSGINPPARSVANSFTNGFLTSVAGWADSISYHTNGMLARVDFTNGASYSQALDPYHRLRPGSIAADTAAGTSEFFYSYDGSGNVVSLLDSTGGGEIYLYDRLGRLSQATLGGGETQSYQYDGFGNLTRIGSRSIAVVPTTNRLSAAGYDDRGNVTVNGVYSYNWDSLDMMQSLRGGGNTRVYIYTADDERILSHDCQTQTSIWRLRGLDGKVLREYRILNNGDLNSCDAAFAPLTGPTWVWEKDWVYRNGTLLGSVDKNGQVIHYHPDHLGTPRLHTGSGGVVLGNASYFPYGEPAPASALAFAPFATLVDSGSQLSAVSEGVMRFTGHERDPNSDPGFVDDLDYMHARYYSPLLARFLSVDPVVLRGPTPDPQRWNRYGYVAGSPLSFVDPDGRSLRRVHAAHTRDVLESRGFSSEAIALVARSNVRSDSGFSRVQLANHATSLFLSDSASNERGKRFAQRKLRKAIRLAGKGETKKALKALGRALHAAEDAVAHRGIGNVSVTVLEELATGFNGKRLAAHGRQDSSLKVTDTGDPLAGEVSRVLDGGIHEEIEESLGMLVDQFLEESGQEARTLLVR